MLKITDANHNSIFDAPNLQLMVEKIKETVEINLLDDSLQAKILEITEKLQKTTKKPIPILSYPTSKLEFGNSQGFITLRDIDKRP